MKKYLQFDLFVINFIKDIKLCDKDSEFDCRHLDRQKRGSIV